MFDLNILYAVLALAGIAIAFGLILGLSAVLFKVEGNALVDDIDSLLPQTQCGQCGFPGCKPYATAMANEEADINQCPPGGEATIHALADLLGKEFKPLNPENGVEDDTPKVAFIHEDICIGCTKCIQACPVDAILGAAKQMHTVITDECTGCVLCVEPCPVDCIDMVPVQTDIKTWQWPMPNADNAVDGESDGELDGESDSESNDGSDNDSAQNPSNKLEAA